MKKIVNIFFAFLMLFSSFPMNILAEEITNTSPIENSNEEILDSTQETPNEENSNITQENPTETTPQEVKYGVVKASNGIKVRNGAGTSYDAIGTGVSDGQILTIYETIATNDNTTICTNWYKIKYLQVEQGFGYACSNYIEVLNIEVSSEFEASLTTFPESYRPYLIALHNIYPNAVFRAYETDLSFNEVVENEDIEGKNLLWDDNNSKDGLKLLSSYNVSSNTFKNTYPGGGSTWYAANSETIAYYIDPRNFLTETRVFMFESLSYNSMYHTKEGVEKTLKNSFMYNAYVDGKNEKTFSDVIMEAGLKYNISPYYIASRILQETGNTRSDLVKGTYTSYPEYNGYYNFYNFGATGNEIVKNGLKYAFSKGWNSEEKAILGGAELLGKNYISVGQDTSYSQKWNVVCKTGEYSCYTHQYMQNIEAPYSEAAITYNAYKNNLGEEMHEAAYVFTIPVFKDLPESTVLPNPANPINYLSSLIVNDALITNFDSLINEYSITIPSFITNLNIQATAANSKAIIEGLGNIQININQQIIPITVTALNGSKLTYNIIVTLNDDALMTLTDTFNNLKSGIINNNYLSGLTSVSVIKEAFNTSNSAALIEIKDINSSIITDGSVGTGYKVKVTVGEESKELDIVIYGDTNGDTEITILDLLRVQKHLLKSNTLSGSQYASCDINKDGSVTILDLLLVQKHLLGAKEISQ